MESNYKMYAKVYTAILVKLKFDMYIADSSYYINFDLNRIYSSSTRYRKCHTLRPTGSKYLFRFSVVNYLNLYKINVWYVSFIMCGYHWK